MKKNILSLVLVFCGIAIATAQTTEFDAIKMAQTDISGTARYMGMAGAFGALGGDVSAIKDNPAGLGVYRSWEMTTTFNFLTQKSNSNWNGKNAYDDMFKFGFNNVALVMSYPTWRNDRTSNSTGLLQSNFGFSYNRLKNFNRSTTVKGNPMGTSITDYYADFTNGINENSILNEDAYFDHRIPWMSILAHDAGLIYSNNDQNNTWRSMLFDGETVTPSYHLQESGYISEYSISWGGNFSNTLFLGAAINFQSVEYSMRSRYIETFGTNERLDLENTLSTRGTGVSFDVGLIYRPVDFIRLGVSYKTPMKYTLKDVSSGDMVSALVLTEQADYDYEVRIPGKLQASVAYIIGKKAIVSTDFVYTDYKNMKLYDYHDGAMYYEEDNEVIKNTFNGGITVKVGAEYRVTDQLSLRAGFAAETASMNSNAIKQPHSNTVRTDTEYFRHKGTNYFTAGFGYRGSAWYFDAAFVNKNLTEDFVPYNMLDSNPAKLTTRNYDVVATIGLRF